MGNKKHTVEVIEPRLEIDEHLPLQEKGWTVQRIGWIFILSVMVAGGLGLFGQGILSKQTVISGKSKVEYDRFYRYETEMKIRIQSADHIGSVSFPEHYLKKFRLVRLIPEPVNNNTINNAVKYNFLPSDNHILTIYMVSKGYGAVSGTMKINEKESINLNHFIYP